MTFVPCRLAGAEQEARGAAIVLLEDQLASLRGDITSLQGAQAAILGRMNDCCKNDSALALLIKKAVQDEMAVCEPIFDETQSHTVFDQNKVHVQIAYFHDKIYKVEILKYGTYLSYLQLYLQDFINIRTAINVHSTVFVIKCIDIEETFIVSVAMNMGIRKCS